VGPRAAPWRRAPGRLTLSVVLDTTVLIDVLRGRPAAGRLLALRRAGRVPWIRTINVEEIWRGAREGEEGGVNRLFDGLRIVPLGRAEGERAGTWRRTFAARGVTLAQADCLIAAAAVSVGAPLATGNPKDFPMPELSVEHWPVGA
jgi:predicted nucleic acid-binding protein